ncbi:MAG TPA: DUF4982 domain-containing protein, partial [Arachidicoccus sp.]|nr:DUF4982 domain-containing protein [Arachidicoccus sp.]
MKGYYLYFTFVACALSLCMGFTTINKKNGARKVISIDKGWVFHKGAINQNETVQQAAAFWKKVDLPHDWRIHEPYNKNNPRKNGYLPMDIGWYRKQLNLKAASRDAKVFIEFDGVFRNSTIWVNGHKAGMHLSGYTGFVLDITDFLDFKSDSNELTVKVDNLHADPDIAPHPWSEYGPGHEGWWYEGYGIYRHVNMIITHPVHVATWGSFVFSKNVSTEKAQIVVRTSIQNQTRQNQVVIVKTKIEHAGGKTVQSMQQVVNIKENDHQQIQQETEIMHPMLWSPDHPYLYTVVTEVYSKGNLIDTYRTPLGIRWFKFTADSGFYLNGKHLQLRGMNIHADYGGLGTALPDRANDKNIEEAKKMGVNIIRSAHNDPSVALMRACDKMGMLLWVETRYLGKDSFALGSIDDMIYRDRNHPAIICWGLANNSGRNDPGLTDFLKVMNSRAKADDPTRPTVFGCEANGDPNKTGFAFVTDVMGYNGGGMGRDDPDHRRYPNRKMLISEYSSGMGARGIYKREQVGTPTYDTLGDGRIFKRTGSLSSIYDLCLSHEDEWSHIAQRPFLAGGIMWSGIEYLGEPIGWPIVTSQFGVLDIARFKKDAYYYYLQEWTPAPMVHLFPHWNWKQGDTVKVWSYSNQDEVELFLNGKSLGKKNKIPLGHIEWKVPYTPGILKAVAYKGGQKTVSSTVITAGDPAMFQLTADRSAIKADGCDLSFITIDICDKKAVKVPMADNMIKVTVSGGKLLGLCSGNPQNHEDPSNPAMHAFNGKLLAIIQSNTRKGQIVVKVSA